MFHFYDLRMASESEKVVSSENIYGENTDHRLNSSLSKLTTIAEKQLSSIDVFGKDF